MGTMGGAAVATAAAATALVLLPCAALPFFFLPLLPLLLLPPLLLPHNTSSCLAGLATVPGSAAQCRNCLLSLLPHGFAACLCKASCDWQLRCRLHTMMPLWAERPDIICSRLLLLTAGPLCRPLCTVLPAGQLLHTPTASYGPHTHATAAVH